MHPSHASPPHGGVNSPDRKVGGGAPPGEEEGAGPWKKGGELGGSRCGSVMRLRDEVSDEVAWSRRGPPIVKDA